VSTFRDHALEGASLFDIVDRTIKTPVGDVGALKTARARHSHSGSVARIEQREIRGKPRRQSRIWRCSIRATLAGEYRGSRGDEIPFRQRTLAQSIHFVGARRI
jgi:hypothetical protein